MRLQLMLVLSALFAAGPVPMPIPLVHAADQVAELDGFIEPYLVVNVGTGVSGVIDSLTVDRGNAVKKGQVLARLDSRVEIATVDLMKARSQVEAAVALKKAQVAFATREFERRKELLSKGIIPDYEMDEAETTLAMAQQELRQTEEQVNIAVMELKQAEAALARRTIISPINGVVTERFLAPGELASDKPLLKLAQLDPLNVEVIAPVELLGSVRTGQKVKVIPEKPMQKTYTGTVTIVDRVVDAASATFRIRVELPNPDNSLPAGLRCRVRFP